MNPIYRLTDPSTSVYAMDATTGAVTTALTDTGFSIGSLDVESAGILTVSLAVGNQVKVKGTMYSPTGLLAAGNFEGYAPACALGPAS